MASEPMGRLVRYFRHRPGVTPVEGASDGRLVERFALQNDQAAFDALMQRHGPMVLSVCRRVLRHTQDVEDTFQATFLVLVRDAGSIRNRESVASWLYNVAYHLALRLRADDEGRARLERREDTRGAVPPEVEAAWRELQAVLDEELARLPEKYRAPLVLCYLEGKTHEEAARELRWPTGTVKGRLARARELLSRRLTRRGLGPSVGSFAVVLAANTPSAAVPAPLLAMARNAVLLGAVGRAAGAASPRVVGLVDGHARAMFLAKLKSAGAVVLMASLLAGGAGLLASSLWGGNPPPAPAQDPPFIVALPTAPALA